MAEVGKDNSPSSNQGWHFWIDRGGTFTDLVARRPDGGLVCHKLLSENPEHYADAALQGIRDLLGVAADQPIPPERVASVRMGTTVATNALLERKGVRTLLVTTAGLGDLLRIGSQDRPRLFDLAIRLPGMLYEQVLEADERVDAQGQVLRPLAEADLRRNLEAARRGGIESCAIAFLHGYRHTAHEQRAAALAREAGFEQVFCSHETSPLIKLVPRGQTTVIDAYLSPILRRYVRGVASALGHTRLLFMQSNGGLAEAHQFHGRDAILSGPAGGLVGMAQTARAAGFERVIGFDMGGTSTDVSHYAGEYERALETEAAGFRMNVPMMRIHTVAAGGGSILGFDGARCRVGPDSAGAHPGPACYRKGGPLTVTDANVVLGKIQPEFFPRVFGPHRDLPLDREAARGRLEALTAEINRATGQSRSVEETAAGFIEIAVENMANAIKRISVQRGHDVTSYALNCFGAAAGQHACLVADKLGIPTVLIHPLAGVLSAYGMGLAQIRVLRQCTVALPLAENSLPEVDQVLCDLEADARRQLASQGVAPASMAVARQLHLRYAGSNTTVTVAYDHPAAMRESFEADHARLYGFRSPEKSLIVENAAVEAWERATSPTAFTRPGSAAGSTQPQAWARAFLAGRQVDLPVWRRSDLEAGRRVTGPAMILEETSTTVLEPGWEAESTDSHLVLRRVHALPRRTGLGTEADPVRLEIFNNLFMSIAEQMGSVLEKTACSVNIKERLDFSCAVFDPEGSLVANAPHIPVHLGSMSECVKSVRRTWAGRMKPGHVYVSNAPYNGGTHLPDITVITPAFDRSGREILFYVAARGHHADVGGISPGSMPAHSRGIQEEGVLLDNELLVDAGRFREGFLRDTLGAGPYPARNVDQNLLDLQAQVAACEKGVQELQRMIDQFSLDVVQAYMRHVQDNAAESVRRLIDRLRDGRFSCEMDDGARIVAEVTVDRVRRELTVDFAGSSGQHAGNANAPKAVTLSAVLYVFRCLVQDDIPLNDGCLRHVQVRIPPGSILDPRHPAAVAAGNVETSQFVVDTLLGALGIMAGSQGTMNNLTFGHEHHQYYETLCGGAGAGPTWDGASAVHTHMTNTRLTDPEILEWRYPVRLEQFALRPGSGGPGRHSGGAGVVRRIRFLEPMTVSLLSNHRRIPPFGAAGGHPGACGRNAVERRDGSREILAGTVSLAVAAGDLLEIATPGGGGYGREHNEPGTL